MTYRCADSVTPANLPAGFDAYLAYVNGTYNNYLAVRARFPKTPVFGLTISGDALGAVGTDCENGAATIPQTVSNVRLQIGRGVDRPIVYCPATWARNMISSLTVAKIDRAHYRLLLAHWAGEHICAPTVCGYPQADGTQWVDHGGWDESLLDDQFIPHAVPPPKPPPVVLPQGVTPMDTFVALQSDPAAGAGAAQYWLAVTPVGLRKLIQFSTQTDVNGALAFLNQTHPFPFTTAFLAAIPPV